MFRCNFCGKEFDDVDKYVEHINNCSKVYKDKKIEEAKIKAEKDKDVNEYIESIKTAEDAINKRKEEFKSKYPIEYEMNFGNNSFYGRINDKEYKDSSSFFKDWDRFWCK